MAVWSARAKDTPMLQSAMRPMASAPHATSAQAKAALPYSDADANASEAACNVT